MGRALDPKKIKSAQRVLEVLEYFTHDREEATVMDIARAMGYPQSSTSELLSRTTACLRCPVPAPRPPGSHLSSLGSRGAHRLVGAAPLLPARGLAEHDGSPGG